MKKNKKRPVNQEIIRDQKGRFTKGHSGNVAGKPTGTLDLKTRLINKLLEDSGEGKDHIEIIYAKLLALAEKGEIKAITEVLDRALGRATQTHEISGPGGGAIPSISPLSPEQEQKIRDKVNEVLMEATK